MKEKTSVKQGRVDGQSIANLEGKSKPPLTQTLVILSKAKDLCTSLEVPVLSATP